MIENVIYKIKQIVNNLELNLSDKIVLTEAATGAYTVTAVIAAYAGARVIAYTLNTKYGTVEEVKEQTLLLANKIGMANKIQIVTELNPSLIGQADIITNSGHLRPLTDSILRHIKPGAVIPYMFEEWEFRAEDLDVEFCRKNNIKVISTNERHPKIDVFNYLGELAIKQIHDAGKSVNNNTFIIISNNDFGPYLANTISKLAKNVGVFDNSSRRSFYSDNVEWLGEFSNIAIPEKYAYSEAVIFTAYPFTTKWFSGNDDLSVDLLNKLKHPFVIRFAGDINQDLFDKNNIAYYPKAVKPGHMGILLSDIGYDAIIKLQAGGLKVAELALRNEFNYQGITIGSLL